ncbi:MAG: putrescine ABC transporter permease PotH, partial [Pseudomonadota bacterium]
MTARIDWGRAAVIAIPLIWLVLFFIAPLFLVLKISVSEVALQRPPYLPLIQWADEGILQFTINFGNYAYLIEDSLYLNAYLESLKIAGVSTLFCLLIGYPMAY